MTAVTPIHPVLTGAPHAALAPVISIIIACRNGAETLQETLDALTAQVWNRPWEIVLADNGSTDASAAMFTAHAARNPHVQMRIFDASAERGKSYALNAAIRDSKAPWFLFCDTDDVVAPGWLAAMAAALRHHPFIAARMDFNLLNERWMLAYRGNAQENGLARLNHAPYALYAGGGSFGFHRETFETIGDFNPEFIHLEDTDYCIRAHLCGYLLHFVPEALIHIRLRGDAESIYAQAYNYARYRALLRARYDKSPRRIQPGSWMRATQRGLMLARWRMGKAMRGVTGGRRDVVEQATYARRAGTFMGDLAGSLAYGVPPNS